MSNSDSKSKLSKEIKALVAEGFKILTQETKYQEKHSGINPRTYGDYQNWYTKCLPVIKQLLPDRYDEFISYYSLSRKPAAKDFNPTTYTISPDYS